MMVGECFVSVVAPVHNDSEIVQAFITEVIKVLRHNYVNYELVLVDDGSDDDTVRTIYVLLDKYECIRVIRLSRECGEETAISAGLDSVIGDYVVVMLPNSDPPQVIPEIVRQARNGAGIVFGVNNNRSNYSLMMRAGSSLFHWYCKMILKLNLPRGSTQFRVLSRQAVNAVIQSRGKYRYLRILSSRIGYLTESFVYEPINRNETSRKRSLFEAASIAMNIIIKTSRHPLRFVSWLGVGAGILNIVYTSFVVYSYIFGDEIARGWTTLSLQSAAMFFFVFVILTVMSEYIGHILFESEDRPLYYVLEERNSSVLIANGERRNVVEDTVQGELRRGVIGDGG